MKGVPTRASRIVKETAPGETRVALLPQHLESFYAFALAAFLGHQVIGRVPVLLHTPLMSATNAISGISLIASLVLAGAKGYPTAAHFLGFIAVTTATVNIVGGFGITDRMLKMFDSRTNGKAATN